MGRGRVASVAVAALAAVPVLASCALAWSDQPIGSVTIAEDDRTLTVGHHCHHDTSVHAEVDPTEERLTFRTYDDAIGDCANVEQVTLDAPLAGRPLVDATTGQDIEPCREDRSDSGAVCR